MAKIHFRTISREIRNAQKGLRSGARVPPPRDGPRSTT